MRRLRILVFAAGAAALLGTGCAKAAPTTTTPMPSTTPVSTPAAAIRAASLWGRAIAVPGLVALNKARNAEVRSVSCAALGSCAATGFYTDSGRHQQGFVAVERNGRWRQAIEVPGLGALNKGRNADVNSVSCAVAGSCAAVGGYTDGGGHRQGFVVSEVNGVWGRAIEVLGLGFLNMGGHAEVSSVSCASRGSCAAVGFYTDGGGHQQGFVAVGQNGVWDRAVEVPGLGAVNKGGAAYVSSVSCASPGNCAAGGHYAGASKDQAFVISEVNGTWATAKEVAGKLNSNGPASVTSVSCASAGNCSAGGTFDYGGYNAAFVVSEKNGAWGQAINVPGLSRVARDASLHSVSCASAGNCAAGGGYDGFGSGAWVVRENNGVWGKQTTVPGLGALGVNSVSCASAGSCVARRYSREPVRGYALQGFVT